MSSPGGQFFYIKRKDGSRRKKMGIKREEEMGK